MSEPSVRSDDDDGSVDLQNLTENFGTNLDSATVDFLTEVSSTRALRLSLRGAQLSTNDFVEYLGIDLAAEPELTWIAREMCCAPMPPNAEMLVSKSNIVYFHDIENDYYTLEHPLTQRYLKVLERQRLEILAVRSKPSINKLLFHQPDILFHNQFRNLQLPCQDCGNVQSAVKCEQCVMSFCQNCFDNLHKNAEGPRRLHTTLATCCGSLCSSCGVKKPAVYCANCEDYFCFPCFKGMHAKGFRSDHRAMVVAVSDAEIVERERICEECCDAPAGFRCDFCNDDFCVRCFWKTHLNGNRRNHTVTKVRSGWTAGHNDEEKGGTRAGRVLLVQISVNPLCSQCERTRATVFCEQCQELLCTDCFTFLHFKGNRQLHLFLDASNLLVLLERLDPAMEEHLKRARPKVIWAVTALQGWVRGIEARQQYRARKELVTKIQRRWRGAMTRTKLLGMLDHFKWRKKQISNFFMPKTRYERRVLRQKFHSQAGRKEVASYASAKTLKELRTVVMKTAGANPMEDIKSTAETMEKAAVQASGGPKSFGVSSKSNKLMAALPPPTKERVKQKVITEGEGRFHGKEVGEIGKGEQQEDVSALNVASRVHRDEQMEGQVANKDPRQMRDFTLREVMKIDQREQGSLERADTKKWDPVSWEAEQKKKEGEKEKEAQAELEAKAIKRTGSYRTKNKGAA